MLGRDPRSSYQLKYKYLKQMKRRYLKIKESLQLTLGAQSIKDAGDADPSYLRLYHNKIETSLPQYIEYTSMRVEMLKKLKLEIFLEGTLIVALLNSRITSLNTTSKNTYLI